MSVIALIPAGRAADPDPGDRGGLADRAGAGAAARRPAGRRRPDVADAGQAGRAARGRGGRPEPRACRRLQDENAFLQRLLADPSSRSTLPPPRPVPDRRAARRTPRPAVMVAAGILLSRLVGLVRNRVFAHYFGTSDAADAFNAAFRIPNFLQNLFGEGVLSASFIPVYAGLRARGEDAEAATGGRRGGGAARRWSTAALVLVGVLADALAHRRHRARLRRARSATLTIRLVRILFPGRRPAGALGLVPGRPQQPPAVLPLLRRAGALERGDHREPGRRSGGGTGAVPAGRDRRLGLGGGQPAAVRRAAAHGARGCSAGSGRGSSAAPRRCATVLRNFGPVFVGRGVVQISAYVDTVLASLLPTGAVAGLSYAQVLYTLPVSLFGMSVSAAELPAMASARRERGRARGLAPGPARRRAAPDRVLRRAVGDGVPRARRRGRRRAVPVGRVHPRR